MAVRTGITPINQAYALKDATKADTEPDDGGAAILRP
jgi:hypothetical protein